MCDKKHKKKHKANIFSLGRARPFNRFNFNQIYKKSQGKYVPVEITIQDEKVRIFCYLKNAWTVDEILFWVLLPKFQLVPQGLTDRQRQLENIKSVSLLARIKSVLVSMKALSDIHNH